MKTATDAELKAMGEWLEGKFGPDYGADRLGALMLVLDYDRDDAYHRCNPQRVDKLEPKIRELWEQEHGPVPDRADKPPPMTQTARSIRKVLVDLGIIEVDSPDITICRTNAGYRQKSEGAWSWWAGWATRPYTEIAGSPYPCGEIIKAHRKGKVSTYTNYGFAELNVER